VAIKTSGGTKIGEARVSIQDPLTRGEQKDYGIEAEIFPPHQASLEVTTRVWNRKDAYSAPSQGQGDFALSWSAYCDPQAPPGCYWTGWWQAYADLGYDGASAKASGGTFTPVRVSCGLGCNPQSADYIYQEVTVEGTGVGGLGTVSGSDSWPVLVNAE